MGLFLGLAAVAAFLTFAHWISPELSGAAGEVFQNNMEQEIDATALIYTDYGDVREFLVEDGRYGIELVPLGPF